MIVEYEIVPASHPFVQEQHPDMDEELNALVKFKNGTPVEVLAFDGGEPEDNTFTRDWSWVAPALEQAYFQGYKDGYDRGKPRDVLDMD